MQFGKIIDLKPSTIQYGVQGIKGGQGYSRTSAGYYNGYGAWTSYPEPVLYLVWVNLKNGKKQSQEIRALYKSKTNNRRLTKKAIAEFLQKNAGKIIPLEWKNDLLRVASFDKIEW